ncbi:chlorophyllase-1-like protein [Carex littledalei]|uniref:Chlorophyllase-1-like protein n=1 Tax=Carex littledalei TaxID=544730 RepID=A0A833QVF5_9POAL|nr:chlorophyllase-1-like protein [Carex littledalei]
MAIANEKAMLTITTDAWSLFEIGKLNVTLITKKAGNDALLPPKEVLIVSPTDAGIYPVLLFIHGFFLQNHYYTQLIRHISSHGFIVVAPQLFCLLPQSSTEDVTSAAAVSNWLPIGLQSLLPPDVKPDFEKLTLAGHSRGGHTAFSLALGHAKINLKFTALIGIDPVAGMSKSSQVEPKILTCKPESFNLDIPALVIGSGFGDEKNCLAPACAPEGVNHTEFYFECPQPCYHFVVTKYGHLDMLDDHALNLVTKCLCKKGNCRDIMRRCTAGITVAFLKAYLEKEAGYLKDILAKPELAPGKLDPVEFRQE